MTRDRLDELPRGLVSGHPACAAYGLTDVQLTSTVTEFTTFLLGQ